MAFKTTVLIGNLGGGQDLSAVENAGGVTVAKRLTLHATLTERALNLTSESIKPARGTALKPELLPAHYLGSDHLHNAGNGLSLDLKPASIAWPSPSASVDHVRVALGSRLRKWLQSMPRRYECPFRNMNKQN